MMIYGTMRFGIQFLRFHEIEAEKHLFLFMDTWQLISVITVITGIIWFSVSHRKNLRTGTDNIGDLGFDIVNGDKEA